jgi:CarboxypepD_reg-like domain
MYIKFICALIFCCLLATTAIAQQPTQTIRGTVLDNASSQPIGYATVAIVSIGKGCTTDSLGNFAIPDVPTGRYEIEITFSGYERTVLKEVVVTSAKELVLNIALNEKIVALSDVVIQAKNNKENPINSLATVSAKMLSVEEAKRYAGGFDDPARLVSAFAGVSSNVSNNGIVVSGNRKPQSLCRFGCLWRGRIVGLEQSIIGQFRFFYGRFSCRIQQCIVRCV